MRTAGLVDLQVNGFAGVDFNDAKLTPQALDHALEAMLASGVTTCLPTLITATPEDLAARFAALDRAVAESRLGPAMCPGYHLEGPFLNDAPGFRGCHPFEAMRDPDAALVERLAAGLKRPILLVTCAPERAGGVAFVRAMAAAGRVVAIGHAHVDFAIAAAAAAAGASLSTHLGNGLPQQMHKLDNPVFAQLAEDRLSACFIADGIHLPPLALKALIRAKGVARSILVTDAVAGAAAAPGLYQLAGMAVERDAAGAMRLPGATTLAGSALTLDQAVRNVVGWGFVTREEAIAMASAQPLAALARALAAQGVAPAAGEVTWTDELRVAAARVGDVERRFS
ncbi:MAG: amidohydrolase family protein [Methylobacteriaceae bacterium]|nr:amidohydrolase family protein [Methylobacteriaceae bacterium]